MKKAIGGLLLIAVITIGGLLRTKQATQGGVTSDKHKVTTSSKNNNDHHTIHSTTGGVLVIKPKHITKEELSEKTYIATIYSPYFGQVYPFREGIIKELYVDVGDIVTKGQILGKLTSQTFAPELANMQASRQSDITSARGSVQAAKLKLQYALDARQTYVNSVEETPGSFNKSSWDYGGKGAYGNDDYLKQIEQEMSAKAKEVLLKVQTLQGDIDRLDTSIELEKKIVQSEKNTILAEIDSLETRIQVNNQKVGTSLRYAYNQILHVFYDGNYNQNSIRPRNFGARDTSSIRDFEQAFYALTRMMLETEKNEQQEEVRNMIIQTLDLGVIVLDNTVSNTKYTVSDLIADRQILINAKVNGNAGITTIGTENRIIAIAIQNEKNQQEQLLTKQEIQIKNIELSKQQKTQEIESLRQGIENELVYQETKLLEKKRDVDLQVREQQIQEREYTNQQRERGRALQEYDKDVAEAQAEVTIAKARLAGTQQALGILQSGGYNNNITAPFNGTITKRFLTIGQTVSAEKPIFDLVDSSKGNKKFIRFDVPEDEFDGLSKGQDIKFLRVQDPVRHYPATISRIANAIDEETKSILVEAQLDNDNDKILIGSTVVVMFEKPGDTALVPTTAVTEDSTGDLILWKVIDDIIVAQIVKTGKTIGDQIYITSGLNLGDNIVSDASQVEGKETGDRISVLRGFQASKVDQGLDALGDGHDHEH